MSIDVVDDLHAAEDELCRLGALLADARVALSVHSGHREMYGLTDDQKAAIGRALDVCLEVEEPYCRPSCHGTFIRSPDFTDERGTVWEGECCDPNECGCPCGHNGEEVP